jgi:hypothetical protein
MWRCVYIYMYKYIQPTLMTQDHSTFGAHGNTHTHNITHTQNAASLSRSLSLSLPSAASLRAPFTAELHQTLRVHQRHHDPPPPLTHTHTHTYTHTHLTHHTHHTSHTPTSCNWVRVVALGCRAPLLLAQHARGSQLFAVQVEDVVVQHRAEQGACLLLRPQGQIR